MYFSDLADNKVKMKETEKTIKYLDLVSEQKEKMESNVDGDTNCNWCTWNDPQNI